MATALPLEKVPAFDRLSQLASVKLNQTTSSGFKGNNYNVLGEGEEVLLTLNEIMPDRWFPGSAKRAFEFDGVDNMGRKLFSFRRPVGKIFISEKVELLMNEALVSVIHLEHTFLTPIFNINDALDNPVIRLKWGGSKHYELQTNDKTVIGGVQKLNLGWKKEFFSYNDDYDINFPADLAVPFKLAVIVACVYIDFKFHEGK